MSDKFVPISMKQLCEWIFKEYREYGSIFGIPEELFFKPKENDTFKTSIYGTVLETPFGVAAGPHTQMAQNIISAWLCGARFIELKTVQTLDELDVSKPCIDMLDAGYNVEWSQELKLKQSFEEYLRAWVLIHALHHMFDFPGNSPGTIFNLSVGYNLEGILNENVQNFLNHMNNAGALLDEYIAVVGDFYPEIQTINIPSCLSNNITLSTMHGCPPEEIGKIAAYLIEERGYNTNIKLNPTLLGDAELRDILNSKLGYKDITVPDIAFGHDLKYKDAVPMLKMLQVKADNKGVTFGVKLSNTLEVENSRNVFKESEKMMYMSGRPLHAITVNLAEKLSEEFDGKLLMSFAGGADCFNVAELIKCGMKTITVSSDILRPGSYTRILQYIKNLRNSMQDCNSSSIDEYIMLCADCSNSADAAMKNLNEYRRDVLSDPKNLRDTYLRINTKTNRSLGFFDCIKAPCMDTCPINQNVPEYLRLTAEGKIFNAAEVIRKDNALASILGRACNHECEVKCTRTHYDEPLAIRELKRFIIDSSEYEANEKASLKTEVKVGIIGAGPAGLSAAYFLIQNGCSVNIYEAGNKPAGMVSGTIPGYRAGVETIKKDIDILENYGVEFKYNCRVGCDTSFETVQNENDFIIIGVGAQLGVMPGIPGENIAGVIDGIDFLRGVKENREFKLGADIGVIGGGDVAIDCARSANRLSDGSVFVIYRRIKDEMPAHKEEIDELFSEQIKVFELVAPVRVIADSGRIKELECVKMELGAPDASGRRRPIEIKNSEFRIKLDSLIMAIGQKPDFSFLDGLPVKYNKKGYLEVDSDTMGTGVKNIYAVGDAVGYGPETIVKAAGDGKKAAADILRILDGELVDNDSLDNSIDRKEFIIKRAKREFRVDIPELPLNKRNSFEEVIQTLNSESAVKEAERCLQCDKYCGTCVSVCPNKALFSYEIKPCSVFIPSINGEPDKFEVKEKYQVGVFTGFCNECGNCETFCPTSGKPYADKVRLYNDQEEFAQESDNAFMILKRQ